MQAETFKGIDQADNFLFVISPESIEEVSCINQINYAESQGKRIMALLLRDINEDAELPPVITSLQWINFVDLGDEKGFENILRNLNVDREHVQGHTK